MHFDLGFLVPRGSCAIERLVLQHIFVHNVSDRFEILSRGFSWNKVQVGSNISLPRAMSLQECRLVKCWMFRFELSEQVPLSGTYYDFVVNVGLYSSLAPVNLSYI
jgi:hypothetical protein